jgi:co-chaperonin GroES (HSP10)
MTSASIGEVRALFAYGGLEEAFPKADPGIKPFGSRVLVQIRTPKSKSAGGIILHQETRETDLWNTQVAKVIALGPVAFHNRDTLQPWPEGNWCQPGLFVRVPKYGGDRFYADVAGQTERALFVLFNDLDLIGEVTCDPLSVIAFI